MLFSDEFIGRIEEDPLSGIVAACELVFKKLESSNQSSGWTTERQDILLEATGFVQVILESNKIKLDAIAPHPRADINSNCENMLYYLETVHETLTHELSQRSVEHKYEQYKNRYASVLKGAFAYEFSQGDLERIQVLINELRENISDNKDLDDDHRRRLLKRLERLQAELHKRVSDLDHFWGLVGDAGVVLGKLGTDAKPIVDRVREVAEIVWKTQARTEELPSNTPNPILEDKGAKTDNG